MTKFKKYLFPKNEVDKWIMMMTFITLSIFTTYAMDTEFVYICLFYIITSIVVISWHSFAKTLNQKICINAISIILTSALGYYVFLDDITTIILLSVFVNLSIGYSGFIK